MGTNDQRIAVLGAGSWGTALAVHLAAEGVNTTLWAREREVVEGIAATRHNPLFLSQIEIPDALEVSGDLVAVASAADILVSAIPVPFIRSTLGGLDALSTASTVVTVSKGIEAGTLLTPHGILGELGVPEERIVALSGPSFALDVARHEPVAVVAAGKDSERAHLVQELFATDRLRVYASDDIVGVEIGGALKNVIALAAGMSDGAGLGDSARAGLITRGLAEIMRLGQAVGGNPATFAGLSGIGDLVLTCSGDLSRNRRVGLAIGQGRSLHEVSEEMSEVAEGVPTTRSARELARRVGVELPITEQVYRLLFEGADPREVIDELLTRDLRDER